MIKKKPKKLTAIMQISVKVTKDNWTVIIGFEMYVQRTITNILLKDYFVVYYGIHLHYKTKTTNCFWLDLFTSVAAQSVYLLSGKLERGM